jgi:hypothetical protein
VDLNDPNGPRQVEVLAPPARVKRVLEAFITVGTVYVERFEYPSSTSGGWNSYKVSIDGTLGGYEWRIYFLSNTGTHNGFSFPPGSGNIDPLTVTYVRGTQVLGTEVRVQGLTYQDGSTPIDGAFVLQVINIPTPILYPIDLSLPPSTNPHRCLVLATPLCYCHSWAATTVPVPPHP